MTERCSNLMCHILNKFMNSAPHILGCFRYKEWQLFNGAGLTNLDTSFLKSRVKFDFIGQMLFRQKDLLSIIAPKQWLFEKESAHA